MKDIATTTTQNPETGARNRPGQPGSSRPQAVRRPRYRIQEMPEAYVARVYLPGVTKTGVQLNLHGRLIEIAASRTDAVPAGWKPISREIPRDDFALTLELGQEIESQGIKARMEEGVLELTLPRTDAKKTRQITIEGS